MKNEKTFIKCRDRLVQSKLFEYKKGKKGSPNQYKINTVNFTVQIGNTVKNTVHSTVQSTVYPTVKSTDINRLDEDVLFYLFNKYKSKIEGKKFNEKIKLISECKNEQEYMSLDIETQDRLFNKLMAIK